MVFHPAIEQQDFYGDPHDPPDGIDDDIGPSPDELGLLRRRNPVAFNGKIAWRVRERRAALKQKADQAKNDKTYAHEKAPFNRPGKSEPSTG
jgi:hypothetical protein